MAGWPSDADLANRLGLAVTDDPTRVAAANAAATANAANWTGLNPATDPLGDDQAEGVLMLGQWFYGNRNRPEGLDSLNPLAAPYYNKVAYGKITRGAIPVA